MREIVLSPSFVQRIQELNTIRGTEEILNTVRTFARALDMMPCEMAEDMIYHGLVTSTLAGRQLDQEELVASLNELWRIRAEKGDGFTESPTANWKHLRMVEAYKTLEKGLETIEMGLVLSTIADYLKNNTDTSKKIISQMEEFKANVRDLARHDGTDVTICRLFYSELIGISTSFVEREDYLSALADNYDVGNFAIAFASLLIKMAMDTQEPKQAKNNLIIFP